MNQATAADGPLKRRAAAGFILVSVCLDVLSLGVVIPVFAPLVQRFEHGDPATAGRWMGIFAAVWALAQFVGAPILGGLSDRFGRRPVLLISLFGLAADYLLMAFAPSLPWLFAGRLISGLTAAGMAVANAYIADVIAPEKRAQTYGLIGAAWGVGFILGPSIGGLLGDLYIRLPFIAAAALTLVGALYGALVLPESLAPESRSPFRWAKANPLGSLSFVATHRSLVPLFAVNILLQFAHNVLPTVFILYAGNRYGWTLKATGPALALTGLCNILVQGLLVRRVAPILGDRGMVLIGLVFGALGFAAYGLAPSGLWFLAGTPVFALIGLFGPGFQGLITRAVPPNEQGRLQGANQGLTGLTSIAAPPVFGFVYAWFVTPGHPYVPGSAFLLAAAIHGLAAVVGAAVLARPPRAAAVSV